MRVISLLVLLGFTLVSPASALAESQVAPPFSKLFRPASPVLRQGTPATPPGGNLTNQAAPPFQPPKVVCGMTMIPVDPSFDANIRRPVPPSGAKFTIKTVKPSLCGQ